MTEEAGQTGVLYEDSKPIEKYDCKRKKFSPSNIYDCIFKT